MDGIIWKVIPKELMGTWLDPKSVTSWEALTSDVDTNTTNVLNMRPLPFLQNVTNPCWIEKLTDDYPYGDFMKHFYKTPLRNTEFSGIAKRFRERVRSGIHIRMRCLPYFFIIGPQKSGTTDLYKSIVQHPQVIPCQVKEPHWWTRSRVVPEYKTTLTRYIDLFDMVADTIAERSFSPNGVEKPFITGEATPELIWDNWFWRDQPEHVGINLTFPEYIIPNYISAVIPQAKLIAMFRNPVDRAYSEYVYFGKKYNTSAREFHTLAKQGISWIEDCLKSFTRKKCLYEPVGHQPYTPIWNPVVGIRLGMYSEFLVDWFAAFKKEQLYIDSLENYKKNRVKVLDRIFHFLGIGSLSQMESQNIGIATISNSLRKDFYTACGELRQETREMLETFYRPYNEKLVQLTNNSAFSWHPRDHY